MTRLLIPLVPQPTLQPAEAAPVAAAGDPVAVSGPSLGPGVAAVSGSADACLLLDPRGAVVAASAAAARLLDREVAELVGRELPRAAGFVDFHAIPRAMAVEGSSLVPMLALRSDTPARGLMRVRRANGTLITCDTVASPLHDQARAVTGVLVLLEDVSR